MMCICTTKVEIPSDVCLQKKQRVNHGLRVRGVNPYRTGWEEDTVVLLVYDVHMHNKGGDSQRRLFTKKTRNDLWVGFTSNRVGCNKINRSHMQQHDTNG